MWGQRWSTPAIPVLGRLRWSIISSRSAWSNLRRSVLHSETLSQKTQVLGVWGMLICTKHYNIMPTFQSIWNDKKSINEYMHMQHCATSYQEFDWACAAKKGGSEFLEEIFHRYWGKFIVFIHNKICYINVSLSHTNILPNSNLFIVDKGKIKISIDWK